MDIHEQSVERSFDAALRREMEYLIASDMFRKSPRLSQLLAYLVGATLRGEGETLKSYTVAVDGLGRSPDFDAQADSYPRVQVMRLRNFLASFYARYEPVGDLCIYLLPGSYRVRMAKFAIAYPDIVVRNARRRLGTSDDDGLNATTHATDSAGSTGGSTGGSTPGAADIAGSAVGAAENATVKTGDSLGSPQKGRFPRPLIWAGAIMASVAAALMFVPTLSQRFQLDAAASQNTLAPTLIISPIAASRDIRTEDVAVEIEHGLENGIAQSWVVNALGDDEGKQAPGRRADYRLDASLSRTGGNGPKLLMELVSKSDGRIIWSNSYPMDFDRPVGPQLQHALAQIASPLGVIGRRELAIASNRPLRGYTCLLAAQYVIAGKTHAQQTQIPACLNEPISDRRLDAVRLGSSAIERIKAAIFASKRPSFAKAESIAMRAVDTYPSESYGYFALAWMNYLQNRCDAANGYAVTALRQNSYEPIAVAHIASFADDCNIEGGDRLVEQALENRIEGSPATRLAIITLAVKSGRADVLRSVSGITAGLPGRNDPAFLLGDTIIAAYLGNTDAGRQYWRSFTRLRGKPGESPDELLRTIIFAKSAREEVLRLLADKAIIKSA